MAKKQIKSEKLTPFGGIFVLWNSILSLMKSSCTLSLCSADNPA